jgi:hypothetical protein
VLGAAEYVYRIFLPWVRAPVLPKVNMHTKLAARLLVAVALTMAGLSHAQTTLSTPPANGAPAPAARTAQAGLAADIRADAPSRYTIKSGDTLWGISTLYLKSPWRWPDLWRMNRDDIKNPHLIFPGQTLVLTFDANGQPSLVLAGAQQVLDTGANIPQERALVRVSPQLRFEKIARDTALPSIPPAELEPFLTKPLVIDANALDSAPEIILTDDRRVVLARGDIAYVLGLKQGQAKDWHVYRPTGQLRDPRFPLKQWYQRSDWYGGKREPDVGLLGYEASYLGDARVTKFADVSRIEIVNAKEEIVQKDRLIVVPAPERISYVPRAPEKTVDSVVIRLNGPVAEAGRGSVVAIAAGAKDGMEVGHVIAFDRPARQVANDKYVRPGVFSTLGMTDPAPSKEPQFYDLPGENIGLGFVFRTFERVSYVYVLSSSAMVRVGDLVRNP